MQSCLSSSQFLCKLLLQRLKTFFGCCWQGLRLPIIFGPDKGWEAIVIPLNKFSSDWSGTIPQLVAPLQVHPGVMDRAGKV